MGSAKRHTNHSTIFSYRNFGNSACRVRRSLGMPSQFFVLKMTVPNGPISIQTTMLRGIGILCKAGTHYLIHLQAKCHNYNGRGELKSQACTLALMNRSIQIKLLQVTQFNLSVISIREQCNWWWWYHSLTAHQHQKGHTVPKQVIMIAMSIHVATVFVLHFVNAIRYQVKSEQMSDKTRQPGAPRGGCSHAPRRSLGMPSQFFLLKMTVPNGPISIETTTMLRGIGILCKAGTHYLIHLQAQCHNYNGRGELESQACTFARMNRSIQIKLPQITQFNLSVISIRQQCNWSDRPRYHLITEISR